MISQETRRNTRLFISFAFALTIAFVVIMLVFVLALPWLFTGSFGWNIHQYFDPDKVGSDRFDVVATQIQASATIVQLLGGILFFAAFLATLYQAFQSTKRAEEQIAVSQRALDSTAAQHQAQIELSRHQFAETRRANEEQQRLSEERAITERFTRAIEQLGTQNDHGEKLVEVRLGGIYSLEKIAQDSIERYHWTVMEILTAYVRENSPVSSVSFESAEERDRRPPTDIQAILTVIGRRSELQRDAEPDAAIDLSSTNLRKVFLPNAHLEGVNFSNAQLEGAFLTGAHLEEALLFHTDLDHAALDGTRMTGAILAHVSLRHANLRGAQLEGADLGGADLANASLVYAQLPDADLTGAHLGGAHASNAVLSNVSLAFAGLQDADLNGAHLQNANLDGAHLERTNLDGTHLEGAYLAESFGLRQPQVDESCMDEKTSMPDGIRRSTKDCAGSDRD